MASQDPAKIKMAELMLQGAPWQAAVEQAGVVVSRAGAYWFLTQYCLHGEAALEDRRRGRVSRIVGAIEAWLVETCRHTPEITSREVQAGFVQRFDLRMSVSQINRVQAARGMSRPQEKQASMKANGKTVLAV